LVRHEIVVHELAIEELALLRAFDQRRIVAEIRDQLADQPTAPSRRRKCLFDLRPSFEHELPVWELRVGAFRVFYDVAEDERRVHIRAVRRKQPTQRTEDIV
jgi:mRNA-degrading endonuclease RelE of RelBE toxin-antitoxin system